MAKYHTPNPSEVQAMLGMLYDGLEVKEGDAVSGREPGSLVCSYVDPDGEVVAACACDIKFSAFAGAYLSMMPKGGALDAVDEKQLPQGMFDNMKEVTNILSRLYMRDDTPHLKQEGLYVSSEMPDDLEFLLDKAPARTNFMMDIPNYGRGNVTFMSI